MGKCANCQKRKTNMETMISKLTENEILMCERWETVKKYNIRTDDLEYCYRLLYGTGLDNNCPDCLRRFASQVNNYYNTIREKYVEYKTEKNKPVEKVVKKPIKEVVKKQVVKKTATKKKPTTNKKPINDTKIKRSVSPKKK